MSKAIYYNNWYNKPNTLTHGFNLGIKPIEIKRIDIKLFKDKIKYKQMYQDIHYNEYIDELLNDVIRIKFPYDIKGILKDVVKIEFNGEYKEYIPIIEEFSEENLIHLLNYKTQYLFDVINTYDKYISNHENKHNILNEVFKLTHSVNTHYNKEKMNEWIENFPNFIDAKIKAIKNKQKDALRQKQARLRYKTSQLRFLNIIKQINNLGYYGFNEDSIWHWMEIGRKDDEIYTDLIKQFSDKYGSDHDLITYDDSKLMKDPNEEYYLEKEKEQFIDYLLKNNINWRVC